MEFTTTPEVTMDAQTITTLATYAADVAATDGGLVVNITMGEMADGSRRSYASVTMQDGDFEQEYRITSPAPWNSPAWAAHHTDWAVAIRTGDSWLALEFA